MRLSGFGVREIKRRENTPELLADDSRTGDAPFQQVDDCIEAVFLESRLLDRMEALTQLSVQALYKPLKPGKAGWIGNPCATEEDDIAVLLCLDQALRYVRSILDETHSKDLRFFRFCGVRADAMVTSGQWCASSE